MNSVTVTGKHGPDLTLTAKVFNNVSRLEWDFVNHVVNIEHDSPNRNMRVALTGITTVTHTISGDSHTVVIA